jgi:hypothetical protein
MSEQAHDYKGLTQGRRLEVSLFSRLPYFCAPIKTHPGAHLKPTAGREEHDHAGNSSDLRETFLSSLASEADEEGE